MGNSVFTRGGQFIATENCSQDGGVVVHADNHRNVGVSGTCGHIIEQSSLNMRLRDGVGGYRAHIRTDQVFQ
jgi:hypothetical protein